MYSHQDQEEYTRDQIMIVWSHWYSAGLAREGSDGEMEWKVGRNGEGGKEISVNAWMCK